MGSGLIADLLRGDAVQETGRWQVVKRRNMSGECPKLALARRRKPIQKIKTEYKTGYELNAKCETTCIHKDCSEQFPFNV